MIIELTTKSGATFWLDKDLMTWSKQIDKRYTSGRLHLWPPSLSVGKSVTIFQTDKSSKLGLPFMTSPIITMREIKRDEPNSATV